MSQRESWAEWNLRFGIGLRKAFIVCLERGWGGERQALKNRRPLVGHGQPWMILYRKVSQNRRQDCLTTGEVCMREGKVRKLKVEKPVKRLSKCPR